eukprot:scaffold43380_cov66-Phaeocystis_antarctica.AAC.6
MRCSVSLVRNAAAGNMRPESKADCFKPSLGSSGLCAYTHSWSTWMPSRELTRYTFRVSRSNAGSLSPRGSDESFAHSITVIRPSHRSRLYGVSVMQ